MTTLLLLEKWQHRNPFFLMSFAHRLKCCDYCHYIQITENSRRKKIFVISFFHPFTTQQWVEGHWRKFNKIYGANHIILVTVIKWKIKFPYCMHNRMKENAHEWERRKNIPLLFHTITVFVTWRKISRFSKHFSTRWEMWDLPSSCE